MSSLDQISVKNKKGALESVILCTTVWTDKDRMREAYTTSEFDWMVVEVNALWRRKHRTLATKSKRIPFFCRLCNRDMVDKSELAWHRQQDLCSMYDAKRSGPLKMFPVNGAKGNSEIAAVFRTYNMKLPWQDGGTGGERPEDEPSVGEVDADDVVNLSSDASDGDSAFMSEPPMKRQRYGKSVAEEIADLRRQPKAPVSPAKQAKPRTPQSEQGKGKGVGLGTPRAQGTSKTTTPVKRAVVADPRMKTPGQSSRTLPKASPLPEPLNVMPPP